MSSKSRGLALVSDVRKWARATAICGAAISLLLSLSGCARAPSQESDAASGKNATKKMTVLVTLSPIADVVQNVAGDDARVLAIVPPETDPHGFSPTPDDVKKMSGARAIFRVGHGIDDWLGEMAQNAGENTPILDVTRGPISHHSHSHDSEGAHSGKLPSENVHSDSADAHLWMDPLRVLAVTKSVCVDLCRLQPNAAKAFRRRADAYGKKLRELDAWTRNRVATIPLSRRKLVTSHDELNGFARRYGFEVVGVAIAGGASENGANARDIAELIDKIRAAQVPAIFADASSNPALMKRLADETNVRVVGLRVDALGKPGTRSGNYLGFFRENVNAIVGALR